MDRLRMAREGRGYSQRRLAELAGISQQSVAAYEKGEREPGGDVLVRLAHVLVVSSAYLIGRTDSQERDDRLPPDWVQTVEMAMAKGFTPDQVRRAIEMLEIALGKNRSDPSEGNGRQT